MKRRINFSHVAMCFLGPMASAYLTLALLDGFWRWPPTLSPETKAVMFACTTYSVVIAFIGAPRNAWSD